MLPWSVAMVALVGPVALAGVGGAWAHRSYPALEVERPLVLPVGWMEGSLRVEGQPGADRIGLSGSIRVGLPRVDVEIGLAWWRDGQLPAGAVGAFWLRPSLRLGMAEPPARSAALSAVLAAPFGRGALSEGGVGAWLGLGARHQLGPTRWMARAEGGHGRRPDVAWDDTAMGWGGLLQGELGLQLGPIYVSSRATGWVGELEHGVGAGWRAEGGMMVQATRGFDVEVGGYGECAPGRWEACARGVPGWWITVRVRGS